jgi:hypothetical protein
MGLSYTRKKMGEKKLNNREFDRGSKDFNPAYYRERQKQKLKNRKYILGIIEQNPKCILAGIFKPPLLQLAYMVKQKLFLEVLLHVA